VDIDDQDVQTLFRALFEIKHDVKRILEELLEDDGEEEEEDEAPMTVKRSVGSISASRGRGVGRGSA
jgi:hypothetical protein